MPHVRWLMWLSSVVLLLPGSAARSAPTGPSVKPCLSPLVPATPERSDDRLRAAAPPGFLMGTAAGQKPLREHFAYRETLAHQYASLTPENELKWVGTQPRRGQYSWCSSEALVQFAELHGMAVRGHTLVWHEQLPDWLTSRRWSKAELTAILRDYIHTVVGHYRGRIAQWDVVNEVVGDDGQLRRTLWLDLIGPEYLELAFRWAHEADPKARLYLNEYGAEALGAKSDGVLALVRTLRRRGVPIHGVGLQMHVDSTAWRGERDVRANLARLAAAGVDTAITEMDVTIDAASAQAQGPRPGGPLDRQARTYRTMLDVCLDSPRCVSLTTWGFTDRYSWRASGLPLVFDRKYEPKAAYNALLNRLRLGRAG